jgi:glycosyltransferase involved in cell wall biosynthesis
VTTIALDARETSHMSTGMTAYVRKLREWLPRVAPDLHVVALGRGDNFDVAEQLALPLACARSGAALVHLPTPFVPVIVPRPYVVTIHDLIDLRYPQYGKRKVGPYYRWIVGPVLRRARAVITDDDATVADLERFLGVDPRRVHVIPLGVDPAAAPAERAPRPRPYLLYVGNRRPHKNLATLVAAWASLPAECELDLVFTGPVDAVLAAPRERGEVAFIGAPSDAELRGWYAGAAAYVHPALREGFGLPMLEALREGTPLLAARSAVPAVLRPHAETFDATDVAALRALVLRLLDDPGAARARGAAAQAAVRELTWEHTVRLTADLYRELVA